MVLFSGWCNLSLQSLGKPGDIKDKCAMCMQLCMLWVVTVQSYFSVEAGIKVVKNMRLQMLYSLWLVHSANCSVFQRNLFTPCKVACETRKCGYFCGGTCNGSSLPPQKKHMINHLKIICCIRGCSAQPRKNGDTWLGESIFDYEYLHEFEAKIETARKLAWVTYADLNYAKTSENSVNCYVPLLKFF